MNTRERNPGICVKDLAKELKLDKSAVSRTVEELVQKGYVIREPSQKVFSRIPKDKQEQVLEALRLYNEACEKEEGNCCD